MDRGGVRSGREDLYGPDSVRLADPDDWSMMFHTDRTKNIATRSHAFPEELRYETSFLGGRGKSLLKTRLSRTEEWPHEGERMPPPERPGGRLDRGVERRRPRRDAHRDQRREGVGRGRHRRPPDLLARAERDDIRARTARREGTRDDRMSRGDRFGSTVGVLFTWILLSG